ncbi:MAG TPA: phage portal protein [Acidimicrobiia bacterium]
MLNNLFERRGAYQTLFGSGMLFEKPTAAGMTVNEDTSLRLSAVYACVRLISDTVSTLPYDQYVRRDGQRFPYRPKDGWVDRPSTEMPRTTFWKQILISLLLDGNAFVLISRSGNEIVDLTPLNPKQVRVEKQNGQKVYIFGDNIRVGDDRMLHLTEMLMPGQVRGVSRIEQAKESLGLGLALEEYAAQFFGNGAYAGGVLEFPDKLSPEQRKEIRETWNSVHQGPRRAHRVGMLWGGGKFNPLTVDPTNSQLVDQRKFAVEEIARIFRVPPFMLGVSENAAMAFASIEQQQLFFRQHTIQPYVEMLEDHFQQLLENPNTFIKFNMTSIVRADLATRYSSYNTALLAGFMSVNDVRRLEDMGPVEDGDQYRVPLQNIPLTDAGLISMQQKARVAQSLAISGYTPDSIADLLDIDVESFGLPSVQVQAPPEPVQEDE